MNDYPDDWLDGTIQRRMYERMGWCCEVCGMEFELGSTRAKTARNANGKPIILTVHHLDGDPTNCDWHNLLVCCQRCHLYVQGKWRPGLALPATWNPVPDWIVMRGLAYQREWVQLEMFSP